MAVKEQLYSLLVSWFVTVYMKYICNIKNEIVICQDNTKWVALCSRCQAASSSSAGTEKLMALKELLAVEGQDRLASELEGVSRDLLRQVSIAAKLPIKVSGRSLTMSELRSALVAALHPSDEQKEAGRFQI